MGRAEQESVGNFRGAPMRFYARGVGSFPCPGNKGEVHGGGVVGRFRGGKKPGPRRCFPAETFFSQPLAIFMKCLLSAFMLRDRFFCLAASESFPLSSREAGIGAFLVAAHFPFAFSISLHPARYR